MINLIHNSSFPNGIIILSGDLYEKFMGNLEFNPQFPCIYYMKNLPQKTAIVSTDIFKELT